MQNTCRIMQKTKHIGLLLFQGFSNLCLANAVEPLRAANTLSRSKLYQWSFYGLGTSEVTSSSGLPVAPEILKAEDRGDALLVMPSYGHKLFANVTTAKALRSAANRIER